MTSLFEFLITRSMVFSKMGHHTRECQQDLERALLLADNAPDEFTRRSLRAHALLHKGYLDLTSLNDPNSAMLQFNESLTLNPCANLNSNYLIDNTYTPFIAYKLLESSH